MSLLTTVAKAFLGDPPIGRTELSSPFADIDTQINDLRRNAPPRNYRLPSVEEALGVPSILAAVQLIAGTVGSLSMEAYQNGVLVTDQRAVPRLVQRPNPKTTPREFWRDTAFYLASRGEAWWNVAVRDGDGAPMSLVVVPPWEVTVQANPSDRFNPRIDWLGRQRDPRDMRQLTYLPGQGLRGVGPLQMALAAVSVSIEADAWAANFFSGSMPSLVGSSEADLDEQDFKKFDEQWLEKDNNLPRWMDNGMKLTEPPYNAEKAQLTQARQHQVGESSRIFGIPGPLLEYSMAGSSLTYRNLADIWTQFINQCINPHYLEPMQQEMSDLLSRSTLGRFNTDQLQRGDMLTRYQAYKTGIDGGWLEAPEIRRWEGFAPGNVDFTAVPPSPPQAQFGPVANLSLSELHCQRCGKLVGKVGGPAELKCGRCGTIVVAA